ncbi:MAG: hypothetical protein Q8O30_07385 [Candidatus Omnitrophota bacterium]|nr:hypothetical protein [Candidatus Omnitrophota bacterium]
MEQKYNSKLEQYLLGAVGKSKKDLPLDNPYREVGFDKEKKRLGWVEIAPYAEIKKALNTALPILEGKENFIFVGMGGSINGIKTLFSLFKKHSLHTLDSLDPLAVKEILGKIKDIDKTLVISISKSATTQETQLLSHTLKELFTKNWQQHFLWLSDPAAFDKLDSLGWKGIARLPIQFNRESDIGGRFSSPNTNIFFLPLFILLNKNFKALENVYTSYVSSQEAIRRQAYSFVEKYKDTERAYFSPTVTGRFSERLSSWVVQLFQESLGSKSQNLTVKTICSAKKQNNLFLPLELKLEISDPVASLMSQMYFFQIFIAFYSALKRINFVDQEFVEKYKEEMRKLAQDKSNDICSWPLRQIIEEAKKKVTATHKFIEVVLYFHADRKNIDKVYKIFHENFKEKIIFVFVGSDWNHHSYQAAFGDKNTFYVLLLSRSYITDLASIPATTLKKNVETLKLIGKATYLTLKNKSILFTLSR